MGLSASAGRQAMLTARKSDIEFKVQVINQRRTALAEQSSQLARNFANSMYQTDNPMGLSTTATSTGVGALPGFTAQVAGGASITQTSVATGQYETQMAYVQSLDKELELRETDLQTQSKEIETELDAVKKVIDKNIEISFKTLG